MIFLEHFGITDAGKVRQNNEDSLLLGEGRDPTLFAVADGIGGFEAGEVASSIAIEVLKGMGPDESFDSAIQEANRRILAAAREDERRQGMGTTVVAMRFSGSQEQPEAEIAHVGDSRAYLLRDGNLRPLTEDHSLVAELVKSGDLTRDEAAEHPQKNLITRALGAEEEVEVDISTLPVAAGDTILLCSDGLSDMVSEEEIQRILTESSDDLEKAGRRLVSAALEAGGTDNVTVVVASVREQEEAPADPPRRAEDTTEFGPIVPAADHGGRSSNRKVSTATRDPQKARRARSEARRRRRKRARRVGQALAALVRGLAALVVVAALLSPIYIWGNSRYYLSFQNGEIIVHQGLPYTVGGVKLNKVSERTGLKKSQVKGPYRNQIQKHRLYTKDEVTKILRDLRRS